MTHNSACGKRSAVCQVGFQIRIRISGCLGQNFDCFSWVGSNPTNNVDCKERSVLILVINTCSNMHHIPTELPLCISPLLVGKFKKGDQMVAKKYLVKTFPLPKKYILFVHALILICKSIQELSISSLSTLVSKSPSSFVQNNSRPNLVVTICGFPVEKAQFPLTILWRMRIITDSLSKKAFSS